MAVLGRLADRMLSAVLPKADGGACACNDTWCSYTGCPSGYRKSCRANCDCSIVKCSACFRGFC